MNEILMYVLAAGVLLGGGLTRFWEIREDMENVWRRALCLWGPQPFPW